MAKSLREIVDDPKALLESGLARIHGLMASGKSLGILSASKGNNPEEDKAAHQSLVRRVREHGYGAIQATGRSQWGPEKSIVVPNMTKEHAKKLGNEFGQQAVIHVKAGGSAAHQHWLDAAPEDKRGTEEAIGQSHLNTPNSMGVTILKGVGFNPKDTRSPSRSFTFSKEAQPTRGFKGDIRAASKVHEEMDNDFVLVSLETPPGGMFNPFSRPYK